MYSHHRAGFKDSIVYSRAFNRLALVDRKLRSILNGLIHNGQNVFVHVQLSDY